MKITEAARNAKILELLQGSGAISAEGHTRAVAHVAKKPGRVEDYIIASRILNEPDLLRALSTLYGIRFISAEKLSKVQVHPTLIALVPRKLAEEHAIVPLLYDDKRVLTVVTANPDDIMALNEVKMATGVSDVVPLLARPEAVRCALMKAYHGDATHFENMLRADLFAFVPTASSATGLDLDSGPMIPRPQAVIDLNEREQKRNASISTAAFAAVSAPPSSSPGSGRASSVDLSEHHAPPSSIPSSMPFSVRPGALPGTTMQPSPAVLAALQQVFDEGFNEGRASGRAAGNAEGRASALLRLLRRRGFVVDEGIELKVRGSIDTSVLDMWLDRAMEVATLQAVFAS